MAKVLFVGNLPFQTTESDIHTLFSTVGAVTSASLITHRDTGRSKGFAFVEMGSDEEAEKAIETLNGHELEGRKIVVNEKRQTEERRDFSNSPRGSYGGSRY
jgi:cold-inducible RNA-binding protein